MPARKAYLALLFLVIIGSTCSGRKDPDTGRVRVLYIGDMIRPSPYPIMEAEPLIDVRVAWPVGPDLTQRSVPFAKKLLRQYIPRTYSQLAVNDVIVIDNPERTIFEPRYLVWFRDAVIENGSGLFMVGGNAAFGGRPGSSWEPTPVQDVLPVYCVTGGWLEPGRLKILKPQDEFVSSLPLEKRWEWMEALGGNEVKMKPGARMLAEYVGLMGYWTNPFWATWDVGKGRSFAQTVDWTPAGGTLLMRWPFYADYAVNLMLYVSKNPVPRDIDLMHKLRMLFLEYRSTRSYLYSVIEFAEKIGANMAPVNRVITQASEKHRLSVERYLDYRFDEASETLDSAIDQLAQASTLAFELKDQAMLWIFAIEWLVVTGTIALGGFALWTLMVRRALYKETESTRFST